MRKFGKWTWARGPMISETQYEVLITNSDGADWYALSEKLDERPEKWAVGVSEEDGYVAWATTGKLTGRFAPKSGIQVILVDEVPWSEGEAVHLYDFDGKSFKLREVAVAAERTKEDILADLIKLQEELKAL